MSKQRETELQNQLSQVQGGMPIMPLAQKYARLTAINDELTEAVEELLWALAKDNTNLSSNIDFNRIDIAPAQAKKFTRKKPHP